MEGLRSKLSLLADGPLCIVDDEERLAVVVLGVACKGFIVVSVKQPPRWCQKSDTSILKWLRLDGSSRLVHVSASLEAVLKPNATGVELHVVSPFHWR